MFAPMSAAANSSVEPVGGPATAATGAAVAPWCVAHTRPRCEKKLVQHCLREGIEPTLPTYRSVRKYRGKKVVFQKPLFPGYVFLRLELAGRQKVYQSDYVANLLDVPDQEEFEQQLGDILAALCTKLDIRLAPTIGPGKRVRIKYGPLRGMEAWVESRSGMSEVLLRLDFIGQAAAVKIEAIDLELI
jgi:transcription antitermination factor NusG